MKIQNIKIDAIKPYKNNPRINNQAIDAVKNSIQNFGFRVPLVIDKFGVIIAGHTRYEAAKRLGMDELPCVVAELPAAKAKAYRIADNKVQDNSFWEYDLLEGEMELLLDLGVDLSITGFEKYEINNILGLIDEDINKTGEVDLENFSDEKFKYTCPCCGFKF